MWVGWQCINATVLFVIFIEKYCDIFFLEFINFFGYVIRYFFDFWIRDPEWEKIRIGDPE